ncbi:hypothetical protein [Nonomuraea candida]|uniref:hypothetical protein n=1 Tax=Nonomuraea candida TaxID=359159 RepID=UPI0005BCA984|nr:hypothetical protein [Nonomuraea candida]
MRPIASAALVLAVLATGCANAGFDKANRMPQNDGANANVGKTLSLRNAFLLGGDDPASPPPQLPLYAVLVNDGQRPDQLERITVEGGGDVRLAGPVALPPGQAVGMNNQVIGTVTGARGNTVPMTFTFREAKSVRVMVPVKARIGQYASLTPSPAGPPSATPGVTEPPSPGQTSPTSGPQSPSKNPVQPGPGTDVHPE